jgi:hypothetical protein
VSASTREVQATAVEAMRPRFIDAVQTAVDLLLSSGYWGGGGVLRFVEEATQFFMTNSSKPGHTTSKAVLVPTDPEVNLSYFPSVFKSFQK